MCYKLVSEDLVFTYPSILLSEGFCLLVPKWSWIVGVSNENLDNSGAIVLWTTIWVLKI